VARPVQGKEKKENLDALAALKKEWDRLRAINTWDEKQVYEYWDVVNRLKKEGRQGNFARIFDLCAEKAQSLQPATLERNTKVEWSMEETV
jgi:hypothetical protein